MSHFVVIVDTSERSHEDLLAPYDENINVAPYKVPCHCATTDKYKKVNEEMLKRFGGTFDDVKRNPYNELPEENRPDWEEYIKGWVEYEKLLNKTVVGEVNKNCEECKGTGDDYSTYNPDSKWDWYVVGGRWTGYFPLKDGATGELGEGGVMDNEPDENTADIVFKGNIDLEKANARNIEQANKAYDYHKENKSIFSDIKHKETKEEYVERTTKGNPLTPFAFVDKRGVWHEKADMGWWGMTANEKDNWEDIFSEWFDSLPDNAQLTAVDCHI